MKKILCHCILLVSIAGCCSSLTGDPKNGGFYCWSENKAQERLARLQILYQFTKDNYYVFLSEQNKQKTKNLLKAKSYEIKATIEKISSDIEQVKLKIQKLNYLTTISKKEKQKLQQEYDRIFSIVTLLKESQEMVDASSKNILVESIVIAESDIRKFEHHVIQIAS